MSETTSPLTVEVIDSLKKVPAAAWDACAGASNPFVSHAFLLALEESGSAVARRGWLAQHLLLKDESGDLLGCVPLYLKSHSYGEYVFDHAWAHAYERAGGQYYPKLQSAVPFTPVPGPRLLVAPTLPEPLRVELRSALAEGLREVARRHGVSSLHVTFLPEEEAKDLAQGGFLTRRGIQYHWRNQGYGSFDDFLATLASRKRKQIRRERREVAESGLTIRSLSGREIQPRHWEAFYDCYLATADKRWGNPYLTPEFFERIGEDLAERILLVLAERSDGRVVAGALNLIGSDRLYGRNWGAVEDHRFLHFECCYYRAIDFAIERGLTTVEAGAQGEHKLQRGYLPATTFSSHWIADPSFRAAVEDFLERESRALQQESAFLSDFAPYRKGGD